MASAVDPGIITPLPVDKQAMKNTLTIIRDEITALQALVQSIADTEDPPVAVGGWMHYPTGLPLPNGWFEANGAAISRTTYSVFFDKVNTTYGAGDGVTTFNLPTIASLYTGFVVIIYVGGNDTINTKMQLFGAYVPGSLRAGEVFRSPAIVPYRIAANASGARCSCRVAAAATVTVSLRKNDTEFGVMTIAAGATVATFTGTQTDFAVGDVFTMVNTGSADAALRDASFAFRAERL